MSVDHTKNIIEIKSVSFAYGGTPVLNNVSLNIHEGDYIGVIGPNGGGKTTLLRIILGLLKPTSGAVKLFGTPCLCRKEWSRLGYVPQKAINFDPLFPATVYEVAAMGRYGKKGLLRGLNAEDHRVIAESLGRVEMLEYRDRLIGDLSGGQQQRVFIARALSGEPEVLLLDEPTIGIDLQTQEQFYRLLKKLNKELNLTLILISHDIGVVAGEATEIAFLNQSIQYYGDPSGFADEKSLTGLYGSRRPFIAD
ncbi:MAG: metal ABC transporter ATP-binding protein [Patescibacteria group bacterium]